MCLTLCACSASLPQAVLPHRLFDSPTDAVLAATNRYNPMSILEDREFMGTIYRSGKQFGYTVSSGRIGSGASELHLSRTSLDDVVAFWHTHGKEAVAFQYFSSTDTALVNQFGIPLYLADYTGQLKIYRPGDKTLPRLTTMRLISVNDEGFAEGGLVKDEQNRTVRVKTRF